MKKVLLIIAIIGLIGVGVFIYRDTIFPYRGEFLGFKDVYHKTTCDLVKYSTDKDIKFYPSYQDAIKANNRPCQSCNPKWYTVKELEEVKKQEEERKIQESKDKALNDMVTVKLEERKQQILSGAKKDLTHAESEWKKVQLENVELLPVWRKRKIEDNLREQIKQESNLKK